MPTESRGSRSGLWAPYGWRARRAFVIWPLVIGIVILVFGWRLYEYDNRVQTQFANTAITATATVERVYATMTTHPREWAVVHYRAQGTLVHTTVQIGCITLPGCEQRYPPGSTLTIAYAPHNVSYAVLASARRNYSAPILLALILLFGFGALAVAVANFFLGPGGRPQTAQPPQRSRPREEGG